jgi:DNA-binding transcriptional LysR family regulator
MERYPEIKATLILTDVAIRSLELLDGGYDAAVHVTAQRDSSLVSRRLGVSRSVTCASPKYLSTHGEIRTPRDLMNHNCLLHTNVVNGMWRFKAGKGRVGVRVGGTVSSNSQIALRRAALRGLGIVRLPSYCCAADLQQGTLKAILPNFPPPDETVQVVFPHKALLPRKVRLFIDFLAERFRDPAWELEADRAFLDSGH